MSSKVIFFALMSAVVAFVSCEPIGRIVGGLPINIRITPYQVSMQYLKPDKSTQHFCGGSIISDKFVATAAHCVDGLKKEDLIILVGTSFHDRNGEKYNVQALIPHQNYSRTTQDYDIALVQVSRAFRFSDSVQAIALPKANERAEDNKLCMVSGWGATRQFIFFGRSQLRAADVPIVNYDKCNKNYKNAGGITPRMICAGFERGGVDACQGDSGGPLACPSALNGGAPALFGIVSWGYDCAEPNYPGVYTNVQSLYEWIRRNAGL